MLGSLLSASPSGDGGRKQQRSSRPADTKTILPRIQREWRSRACHPVSGCDANDVKVS